AYPSRARRPHTLYWRFVIGGCVDACLDPPTPLHNSISAATEINLGSHPSFNTKFMDAMMFDKAE
ncbi:MAG: hypothetical protein FWH32_05595, partial [Clostridiales bacterium]|nr:hypothetical protein [Clostridiales bacterium]